MNEYRHSPRHVSPEVIREESLQFPAELDEQSVAAYLKTISRTSPEKLPSTVRAIRQVWAHKMGGWVERGRLDYLNTVLNQLSVSHQILTECLQMDAEWLNHQDQKARRASEHQLGLPKLQAEAKVEQVRAQIEAAKAEQAEARRRRLDAEQPQGSQRELSPEEKREANYRKADELVHRLERRKAERLAEILRGRRFEELSEHEQGDYKLDENGYNDRIRRAKEERIQYE